MLLRRTTQMQIGDCSRGALAFLNDGVSFIAAAVSQPCRNTLLGRSATVVGLVVFDLAGHFAWSPLLVHQRHADVDTFLFRPLPFDHKPSGFTGSYNLITVAMPVEPNIGLTMHVHYDPTKPNRPLDRDYPWPSPATGVRAPLPPSGELAQKLTRLVGPTVAARLTTLEIADGRMEANCDGTKGQGDTGETRRHGSNSQMGSSI
jgi:hypothetical protein